MVNRIFKLRNPIQYYPWGSKTTIPDLLGIPNPEGKPMAELWMGAHPKAPSQIFFDGKWISLLDVLKTSATSILGQDVATRFNNQLPFLFKVLAAAEPLSIQVHPSKEQAMEGFERENRLGIPLDAPERNYRDDNHKPEMLCALTRFEALKGLRPLEEVMALMEDLGLSILRAELRRDGAENGGQRVRNLFTHLISLDKASKSRLVREVLRKVDRRTEQRREFYWMAELGRRYPDDIGVLSPIVLNLIALEPGQAVFLPAGELHAYLRGAGLEIMANSDNVLRGGLTTKHVDVDELLRVTRFQAEKPKIIEPEPIRGKVYVYNAPVEEFRLCRVAVQGSYSSPASGNVEILLCLEGEGEIQTVVDQEAPLPLSTGVSVIVPSVVHPYKVTGQLDLWKATVPP